MYHVCNYLSNSDKGKGTGNVETLHTIIILKTGFIEVNVSFALDFRGATFYLLEIQSMLGLC